MENENNIELKNLAKYFGADRMLSKGDIEKILAGVFKLLSNFKKENEQLNADTKKEVDDVVKTLKILQRELEQDIKDGKKEMRIEFSEHVEDLKFLIEEFKKIKPKDGKPGRPGKDANEQKIIESVLAQVRVENKTEIIEILGENVIDKINSLDHSPENLIDVSRIKGWDKFSKQAQVGQGKNLTPTVISNAMDLDASARADGYAIVWDATNNRHKYAVSAGGGSMAIGGSITSATQGSVLFAGASGVLAQDNANFYWDDAANELGIGTNTPEYTLHVKGSTAGGHALFERTTSSTSAVAGALRLRSTSSGDMADDFGVQLAFHIQDTAAVDNQIGVITVTRANSSDNTGIINLIANNGGSGTTGLAVAYTNNVSVGAQVATGSRLDITTTRSGANPSNIAVNLCTRTGTFTDTTSSGTVSLILGHGFYSNSFAASSLTTYTDAANVYINGAPSAGTNVTLTNAYALWVDAGVTRLDGATWFGSTVIPFSNDGAALGSTTNSFSDLFLATGAVINFNAGDVTITHSANLLSFAGASTGYYFDDKIGITTAAPTHSLTHGSTSTGEVFYNTSDQTTNYERMKLFWSSNVFTILNEVGGTGTARGVAIQSTASTQLTLAYDASNNATFQISSTGDLTINASGADVQIAAASTFRMLGGFATSSTNANANMYIASAAAGGGTSQAEVQIGGSTALDFRVYERGSTAITLSANRSYAGHVIGSMAVTEASSGTHPIIATLAIKPVAITNGTATTTNGATVYIEGPATGTVPTNNYSLWIGSGLSLFGGELRITSASVGTNADSVATLSSTSTFTNKTITALILSAGTATASTAPLKFTSGVNLTTAEAGAMEYDGTWAYFTLTGTTRRTFVFADTAQIITNKRNQPRVYSTANTATLTPEIDTYDIFHITALSGAITIANHSTSTPADGEQIRIRLLDNGTARAISFGTNYVAKSGVALPTTTTLSKNMVMLFEWNANLSKFNLLAVGTEA